MDEFIQGSLESLLKNDPRYQFNVAVDDEQGIVAMFITSSGFFIETDGEIQDIPFGKPWDYLDEDFQMHSGFRYPSLEIDYLAVRKDLREKGYGSQIIDELSAWAKDRNYFFLTVDAYHTEGYSAIPFYKKKGFFPIQEYSDDYDTLRMAMRV